MMTVATIADPADPRLAPYAAMRERDLVGRAGRFIVEGEVTLRLMLSHRARFRTESILLLPERVAGLAAAIEACPERPPVLVADRAVMSAVAGFPIHRGVLAVGIRGDGARSEALVPPAPRRALVVGLAGLTNHDNVGGLFRNAAAFGADAVLLDAGTCDPLYRKAIRVSAGAALTVPFARLAPGIDWFETAAVLGLEPLALSPSGTEDVADLAPPSRVLLVLGTEGPGLPASVLARMRGLRIVMAPGFDSLNVATAGAIALHRLAGGLRTARDNEHPLP